MMAATLASLLTDFSPPGGEENAGIAILRPVKHVVEQEPVSAPASPPVDRQAELVRSAEAKARAEEREAADRRLDEALAAEKVRYEQELEAQREIWAEQQALQLSVQIQSGFVDLETSLSDRLAGILRPFIAQIFHDQAVAEFKETVATILSGANGKHMKMTGPADLLSAIKVELGLRAEAIEFLPSEQAEVALIAQDAVVQTQLNTWLSRLEQALKAE